MSRDLVECLASIGCRLRVKCRCSQCQVADKQHRKGGDPKARGIDLADLLASNLCLSDEEAQSPTSPLERGAHPASKVTVVPQLPMPAGGFCRRSAAVQLAIAQEMCRQDPDDDYKFDCAEHDWPALFAMDLFDEDEEDFGFDFELIDREECRDDDFVLEMVEEDGEDLDGEWAQILLSAAFKGRRDFASGGVGNAAAKDATDSNSAGVAAAANALNLDFRKAIRLRVPKPPARDEPKESAVGTKAVTEAPGEEWPTLLSGAGGPTTTSLSSSPSSVCDVAGQWASVVEKNKEARVPAEAKSRNYREVARRSVALLRRAAERKAALKAKEPVEDFPPLRA